MDGSQASFALICSWNILLLNKSPVQNAEDLLWELQTFAMGYLEGRKRRDEIVMQKLKVKQCEVDTQWRRFFKEDFFQSTTEAWNF